MDKFDYELYHLCFIFNSYKWCCLWKYQANPWIWQGDPLSPSLFLLCAEGLSALIHEAARNQNKTGISIARGCPRVTHLFFADNSILFCKANPEECQELKLILRRYEEALGQKINTDKSSVFFSPNTSQDIKDEIFNILGPMQDSKHTKYLGLLSFIGRSKTQVFSILKERILLERNWAWTLHNNSNLVVNMPTWAWISMVF